MEQSQRQGLRYAAELGAAALLFAVCLAIREPLAGGIGSGPIAGLALALPVLPLWLMFAAIWRHYLRVHEFQRLQFLKASTLAAGFGLFAFASLPFLKAFGLPTETSEAIWLVVPLGWIVALVIIHLRPGR